MHASPEIQAMSGTPGEPVPSVAAKDIRAVWKLGRDAAARAGCPPGQLVIDADLMKRVCSPRADVRAVWFRGAKVQMLDMLLPNALSGWAGRPLREIAFLICARLPMKWWEVGVPRRGLF